MIYQQSNWATAPPVRAFHYLGKEIFCRHQICGQEFIDPPLYLELPRTHLFRTLQTLNRTLSVGTLGEPR